MFKAFEFETDKKEILVGVIADTHLRVNPTASHNGGGYQKALEIFRNNKVGLVRNFTSEQVLKQNKNQHKAIAKRKPIKSKISNGVDLIIHAGDIVSLAGLKDLEKIAPVFAVQGNNDLPEIQEKYPAMLLLKIFNWKIGVLHSLTNVLGSFLGREAAKAKDLIKEHKFDIIISGHTHRSYIKKINNVLLINPGSPNQPFLSKASVAILRISKDSYQAKIIYLR